MQPPRRPNVGAGVKRAKAPKQLSFGYPEWGGKRKGAGRKLQGARRSVPHRRRSPHSACDPFHLTLRVKAGLPSLRTKVAHAAIRNAIIDCNDRFGLRIVHYVALSNHLHLVCEADDVQSLRRGASALVVALAHALNSVWDRSGPVFGDRYHARSLSTPREVRNALAYLLLNAQHHGLCVYGGLDPCSSAAWFDGWMDGEGRPIPPRSASPLCAPRTWLLSVGWKKWGLIELPGGC